MLHKLLPKLRLLLFCALIAPAAYAATLNVGPGQPYTTIQSAINDAASGDTILVAPGTYYENIDFHSKGVTLVGTGGAAVTILDGSKAQGATVTMGTNSGGSPSPGTLPSVIDGFTIRNGSQVAGYNFPEFGGGIEAAGNAIIQNNTLTSNAPAGIHARDGFITIKNNHILNTQISPANPTLGYSAEGGTGIFVIPSKTYPGYAITISDNLVESNAAGGIIEYYGTENDFNPPPYAFTFIYSQNIVRYNGFGTNTAFGIYGFGGTHVITGNLVYANLGPGMVIDIPGITIPYYSMYSPTAYIINNTITGNATMPALVGATELILEGSGPSIYNNIIVHTPLSKYPAMYCYGVSAGYPVTFYNNDLYNQGGTTSVQAQTGTPCVYTGTSNRSEDPLFVNPSQGDFHLQSISPEIDAGLNAAPYAPTTDLDNNLRPQNATGQTTAIIDIGAYEFADPLSVNVTLQSSLNPATYGAQVVFNSQLSSISGIPTGTVLFTDGAIPLSIQPVSATGTASFATSSLAVGSHAIAATYQPTGVFHPGSALLSQVITGFSTTTALTCLPSSLGLGSSGLFNVNVTSQNGTPTGSVSYAENGVALFSSTLRNGSSSSTFTPATAGTHTYVAIYASNSAYASSSASCVVTVNLNATSTTVTGAPNPSSAGQPVTFSATTNYANANQPNAGGAITFLDGTNLLGTATLTSTSALTAIASLSTQSLTVGAHNITAVLNPPAGYAVSSGSVAQTVQALASASTVTVAPASATYGATTVFSANVVPSIPPGIGSPTGTVIFLVDGAPVAPPVAVAGGNSSISLGKLPVGVHQGTCSYSGDSSYLASVCSPVSFSITASPITLTISSSANPAAALSALTFNLHLASTAQSAANEPLTLSLTLSGGSPSVISLVTDGSGNASYTTTVLKPGTYQVAAAFAATATQQAATSAIVQVVTPGVSTTTLGVSPTPGFEGLAVTLTAAVAPTTATGSVTFLDGVKPLATVALTANRATYTTLFASGTHLLSAVYSGDAYTLASNSMPISEYIYQSDYRMSVSAASITVQTGHHLTFTLTGTAVGAFNDQVQFSLPNLPPHATARPSRTTLALNPTSQDSASIYLDTDDVIGYLSANRIEKQNRAGIFAALLLPGLSLLVLSRRRQLPALLAALFAALLIATATGCSGKYPASTPPGTYTLQITAVSATNHITHTLNVPFTVTE